MAIDIEANRRKALDMIERLEAEPGFIEEMQRRLAEMEAGEYYVFDPEQGWHSDMANPVDGCDGLCCRNRRKDGNS